jgi:hypothetical protein
MRLGTRHAVTLVLLLMATPAASQVTIIGWPEAVGRLAAERSKAEICVALLKGHGDAAQISRGQLAYGLAKADFDFVIAGLVTAVAEGGKPESLPSLEAKLEHGASALLEFCKAVGDLLPSTSGQKNVFFEIAKIAIEPLIKSLSEGVAALYSNYRKDNDLVRLTIQTQLVAARWPDFAEVKAAQ